MSSSPRIVVLDGHTLSPGDVSWGPVAALGSLELHGRTAAHDVVGRAQGAPIVLTNKTPLRADTLAALAPSLRMVSVLATGHDVVDAGAAAALGVTVCNVPEYGTSAVAEYVFALIFACWRRVEAHDAAVRRGDWGRCGEFSFWVSPQRSLRGRTLVVVGCGRIGSAVARLGVAFGMEVVVVSRRSRAAGGEGPARLAGVEAEVVAPSDLHAALRRGDVVSLHVPLTPSTRSMIDAPALAAMKRDALLVNTARGALVDAPALARALARDELGGAALDVVDPEPIADDSVLLSAPRCVITPHVAWAAREARERLMHETARNIAAHLDGAPRNVVGAGAGASDAGGSDAGG